MKRAADVEARAAVAYPNYLTPIIYKYLDKNYLVLNRYYYETIGNPIGIECE
jgi:hypothetical protein